MSKFSAMILLLGVSMLVGSQDRLDGQDFRVESKVFVGDADAPASENLTLYQSGLAFDFLMDRETETPAEIVIFDSRKRQLVLLDVKRRLRTDIEDFELLKMLEGLRNSAEANPDANFLLNPELETEFDADANVISVRNDDMSYQVHGKAPEQLVGMPLFYEAMNRLTQLSASDPNRLPPFARMAVNQEIKKHGLFPQEIELTMRAGAVSRNEFRARSTHTVTWQLSQQDTASIAKAKEYWMSFEKVRIGVYRGIDEPRTALNK